MNKEGIQLIKSFEACKLKAYLDSKKIPTIGWGNTYYENGIAVKLGDIITQERADRLFLNIFIIKEHYAFNYHSRNGCNNHYFY